MSADEIAARATVDGSGYASGMDAMISKTAELGGALDLTGGKLEKVASALGMTGPQFAIFAAGAVAVGAALAASVQAAASWETSMAGVAKTTGLQGQDLQQLSQDLLAMSTEMPVAAADLASVAQAAGSLGVAKDDIAGFVEAASMMGVAFEMPAEEAATAGAKILNAFQLQATQDNLMALGNSVNWLGDNFAATEPQILEFVNRASFLSTTMGQSIPQVAALGTVLISAGMNADTAATGIKSFLNMALDPKQIEGFAQMLGTTVESVGPMLEEDLGGALVKVADELAAIEDPAKRFNRAVELAGTEGAPALLKLTGQAENLKTAFGGANSEFENGSSMLKTFEANSATLESQWQIFMNTMNKAAVELGNVLLPVLTDLVKGLTDISKMGIAAGEAFYGFASSASSAVMSAGDSAVAWWADMWGINMGTAVGDGICGGISDSYEEIDSTLTDTTVKAAEEAGEEAGEAWGDAYLKMVDKGLQMIDGKWISQQRSPDSRIKETVFDMYGKVVRYWYDAYEQHPREHLSIDGMLFFNEYAPRDEDKNVMRLGPEEILGRIGLSPEAIEGAKEKAADILPSIIEEINKSVLSENLWESPDTERFWMKWQADNEAILKRVGPVLGAALGSAYAESLELNDATLSESLANVMQAISEPGSVPVDILNQSLADCIDAGLISPGWRDSLQAAFNSATDQLDFGAIGNKISQAEAEARGLIGSPKMFQMLFSGTGEDRAKAEFLIKEYVGDQGRMFRSAFETEAEANIRLAEEKGMKTSLGFWQGMKQAYEYDPQLFDDELAVRWVSLMNTVKATYGTFEEFQKTAPLDLQIKATKYLLGVTEDLNAAQEKQITNMAELGSASNEIFGIISEFGAKQEQLMSQGIMADASFIGSSMDYVEWVKRRAAKNQASISQIQFAGQIQAGGDYRAKLAEQVLGVGMEGSDSRTLKMIVDVDTTKAKTQVDKFIADVNKQKAAVKVGVNLTVNAAQVRAMVQRAVVDALASVRA